MKECTTASLVEIVIEAKKIAADYPGVEARGAQGCVVFMTDGDSARVKDSMLAARKQLGALIMSTYRGRKWFVMRSGGYRVWRWTTQCSWVGGLCCGLRAELTDEERTAVLTGVRF